MDVLTHEFHKTTITFFYPLATLLKEEVTIMHPNEEDRFKITPRGMRKVLRAPRHFPALVPGEEACKEFGIENSLEDGILLSALEVKDGFIGFRWICE